MNFVCNKEQVNSGEAPELQNEFANSQLAAMQQTVASIQLLP